jgi:nucleoside-diphosphate-sugar epimerase
MKVIVTGGTGFLGRHLVWRLAREGHDVLFTGRQQTAAEQVIELAGGKVEWLALHHGSENAACLLIEAAKEADAIIHTAALSSPWGKEEDFVKANVDSTKEVLLACEKNAIQRLVHISTPSIYFDYLDRYQIKENDPLPIPVNDYVKTKRQAEQLVLESSITHRIILRPKAIFGPWDTTLMPRILRVIKSGPVPLIRNGDALLDVTYVENVVEAIYLALTKYLPQSPAIYNVSNGEPQSVKNLFGILSDAFHLPLSTRRLPWWLVKTLAGFMEGWSKNFSGREPAITRYSAGALAFSQTLDISAIQQDLGYQPRVSFKQALQEYADWYQQQDKNK